MSHNELPAYVTSLDRLVRNFAQVEFESLVPKVTYRLQRMPSTGIFGDIYSPRSLWDEYCFEIQEGAHDAPETAWDRLIGSYTQDVMDRIPDHLAVLLSEFAAWDLNEQDYGYLSGAIWLDGIERVLLDLLSKKAAWRDIAHLSNLDDPL